MSHAAYIRRKARRSSRQVSDIGHKLNESTKLSKNSCTKLIESSGILNHTKKQMCINMDGTGNLRECRAIKKLKSRTFLSLLPNILEFRCQENVPTLKLTGQPTFEETLRIWSTYLTAYWTHSLLNHCVHPSVCGHLTKTHKIFSLNLMLLDLIFPFRHMFMERCWIKHRKNIKQSET